MLWRWIERLIVPLFMITAVIGLVYWYWTTTPSYAVQQVVNSVRAHDVDTFTRYVDLDTMGERALDEIIHGPAKNSGIFGNFDSFIGMGIVSLFKSEIVEMFKHEVTKLVAGDSISNLVPGDKSSQEPVKVIGMSGSGQALAVPNAVKAPALTGGRSTSLLGGVKPGKLSKWKGELEDYGLSKKGFKGIDYFKEENGVNLIGLKFHSPKYGNDFIIEFKLEDAGGYWRVTELSNLSDLVMQYLEMRDRKRTADQSEALPAPALEETGNASLSPVGATAGTP